MKHTFSKSTIKRIILEELENSNIEDAADEIVNDLESLLQEGNEEALDKVYDKIAKKSIDKSIDLKKLATKAYEKITGSSNLKRILQGIALASFLGAAQEAAFDYQQIASTSAAQASSVSAALQSASDQSKSVSNFRQAAQAEGEQAKPMFSQSAIDGALDDIRVNHSSDFRKAPIAAGRGIFIDGDPSKGALSGLVYVPASEIQDDEMLPFVGLTKANYEVMLRATFLSGPGGDQRLEDLVLGHGKRGSSGYWSYDNETTFSSVADLRREDEKGKEIAQVFYDRSPEYNERAMLPLAWSVAYELLQKRKNKGRL